MGLKENLLLHINYFTEHIPHEEGQTWEEAFANYLMDNSVKIPVHCKDCVHMKLLGPGYRYCLVWRGVNSLGDEGFCNYGEMVSPNAKEEN